MLRSLRHHTLLFARRHCDRVLYSTGHLNGPLSLDPSLEALLRDADMSLSRHKLDFQPKQPRELQAFLVEPSEEKNMGISVEGFIEEVDTRAHRKSPAARFGSDGIGAIVLPLELESSIRQLIEESDKPQLHNDAKRLFYHGNENEGEGSWEASFDTRYKSRYQRERMSERDGTAFVSVALPPQYAAIVAVLSHVKHRSEPGWEVSKVIDWGCGAGSALWASLHSFQMEPSKHIGLGHKIAV